MPDWKTTFDDSTKIDKTVARTCKDRHSKAPMSRAFVLIGALCLLACEATSPGSADDRPPFTDYCQRLEHEIQGRKHGFLAGNVTYYVGGFHASWKPVEDETIGLTHPFHHDLRSRGVGLVKSEGIGHTNTGTGNDYEGWEFYKDTRVLYGSVTVDGKLFRHPKPSSMRWRPDKMICEYELNGVKIREEKFIADSDAIASRITSSRPITLTFDGQSFYHRNSLSSTASIKYDKRQNAIVIGEGGSVRTRPDPKGKHRVGPCVYSGMTTVLGVSRTIVDSVEFKKDEKGIQHYSFSIPCDKAGTIVSWSMHDDESTALLKATEIISKFKPWSEAKTKEMNRLLNEEVPWFRCSQKKHVDIYYYLWSLYLMYYIESGKGWEKEPHTQTAVNNFLGMHRYDATFQIRVGSWTDNKRKYAYGNVLTWKHLTQNDQIWEFPNGIRLISDNKGIAWHSGAYGPETSEHVLGAWQIYQHTGDANFVKACYEDHFSRLFAKRISGFAMNEFEVADTLEKMAKLLGAEKDIEHWKTVVKRKPEHLKSFIEQRWEMNGVPNFFAAPKNNLLTTNSFWALRSPYFPRNYARKMVQSWAIDKEKGFYGKFFPLAIAKQSSKDFSSKVDQSFGYTPDTAYFVLDGMFRQDMRKLASRLTLNHLENYNFHEEWQVPVAPEAYRRDGSLFGDQYSNFNAGKILLYLEGLGGLKVSIPNKQLTIRPAMPEAWDWMEVRIPISGTWTRIRYTRNQTEVSESALSVSIE